MNNNAFVISLGGSIVCPKSGIDVPFLKKFREFILEKVKAGNRFVIVVGGGALARDYIQSANEIEKLSDEESDWLGITAIRLNAQLLQSIFGSIADSEIIVDPTKKIESSKKVIIGAGYKPGWSTDYDAVLIAKNHGIDIVINLSNIDYVYDKDPNKYKDAKKLESVSWNDFKELVGDKWKPGLNAPFDPIASSVAAKAGMSVVIMNGRKLANLGDYLANRAFKGTVIS